MRSGDDASGADGVDPARLHAFTASLVGLPPEEIRKAKRLYLLDAVAEYRQGCAFLANGGCALIFFAFIPLFWPFLIAMAMARRSAMALKAVKIRNALSVWRDDLGADAEVIERDLEA